MQDRHRQRMAITKKELEDLSVGMINSRKLSVQALVSLNLYAEELYDEGSGGRTGGQRAGGGVYQNGGFGQPCDSEERYLQDS